MASAAGKRQVKAPSLPTGFVYDLPSLNRPSHSASSARTSLQVDLTPPRASPTSMPENSQDLELLKLQIEKQRLEIQVLELEAQAKARSLSSPSSGKPAAIPSLDTVRSGHNAGKSQGQLDHNTRITHPQEWPHLHVPFGLARKKFQDLTTSEFVYGYLDIVNSEPPEKQAVMTRHLMSLMRLASKYDWPAVLSFHAAVLDRIEAGLANWGDDFSEIERFNITESQRLPTTTPSARIATPPGPNNRSRSYCREWNRTGVCNNTSHQLGTEHICAYCKLSDHTIASCPTRPPPSSNRSTPPTSA